MKGITYSTIVLFLFLLAGCSKSSGEQDLVYINLLSVKLDGASVDTEVENISITPVLRLTFSQTIDAQNFKDKVTIAPANAVKGISYQFFNSNSVIDISLELEYDTSYSIKITGPIGIQGETLKEGFALTFSTQQDEIIYAKPPCTNVNDCNFITVIGNATGEGNFEFYANYDIYEDKAVWRDLEKAIIVIHGASVNADDYFSYLSSSLEDLNLSEKTVLISPLFKEAPNSSSDLYWNSLGYRDGKASNGTVQVSSFEVLDNIIDRLADKAHFPALNEIVITGQSSGGRFTHTFAAANRSESRHTDLQFEYVVSESQYFYYPTNERINEQTNTLFLPANCSGINFWPFGFEAVPAYVGALDKETFNAQFISRNITYLLGNGNGSDGSLNTSDCEANLLGSSRYIRGENMFQYMGEKFGTSHGHKKIIAQGVAHDGFKIYTSPEFKALITDLFKD